MPPPPKNGILRRGSDPPRKSLSPATAKKLNEEMGALSSHSSDPEVNDWDPIGKTPKEIAAWCAEFERGQKERDSQVPSPGN
jgi:hypothetical protein